MAKLIPDPFCHQDMVDSGMFVHFDLNNILEQLNQRNQLLAEQQRMYEENEDCPPPLPKLSVYSFSSKADQELAKTRESLENNSYTVLRCRAPGMISSGFCVVMYKNNEGHTITFTTDWSGLKLLD
jgi:hypothetical protein